MVSVTTRSIVTGELPKSAVLVHDAEAAEQLNGYRGVRTVRLLSGLHAFWARVGAIHLTFPQCSE